MDIHRIAVAGVRIDEDRNIGARRHVARVIDEVAQADDAIVGIAVEHHRQLRAGEKKGFKSGLLREPRIERAEAARHHGELRPRQELAELAPLGRRFIERDLFHAAACSADCPARRGGSDTKAIVPACQAGCPKMGGKGTQPRPKNPTQNGTQIGFSIKKKKMPFKGTRCLRPRWRAVRTVREGRSIRSGPGLGRSAPWVSLLNCSTPCRLISTTRWPRRWPSPSAPAGPSPCGSACRSAAGAWSSP